MSEQPFRPWVYIASPYSHGDQAANVRYQMSVFDHLIRLRKDGHQRFVPIAPLWSHFQEIVHPIGYDAWLDYDRQIIERCDVCIRGRLANTPSKGADAEVALFRKQHKKVVYSIQELVAWHDGMCNNINLMMGGS